MTSGPTASPNPAVAGQPVSFTVASTDGSTFTWDLGDGTNGSGASTQHTYATAGTYKATVTIDSSFGTTSTASVDVTVQALAPNATPNPATVGATVTLSVPSSTVATYTWDFGDGLTGDGATVQHAYSPAGKYTAVVTVHLNGGGSSTGSVDVTVNAAGAGQSGVAIDSDGDGFSDELEAALGTNASSATSTPFNGAAAGDSQPIGDSKLGIKLSFAKQNSDSIGISGTIILEQNAQLDGAFVLNVGGVVQSFTLVKGAAKTSAGAVKVSSKGTGDRTAKFSAKLQKGNFAQALTDEGLTNTTVKAKDVSITVTVLYNNTMFQTTKAQSYTAKQGSSGSTKDKK